MDFSRSIDPDFLEESSQTNIEDYTCCICQLIPNPELAIEEENCGHIFCAQCLSVWQKKNNVCPFCKMEISKRSVKDKNKLVYRHLINLMVQCQEENCTWKGVWKDYLSHLKNNHKKNLENITGMGTIFYDNNFELYKYYKSTTHNHPLKFLDDTMDNGWICNGRLLSGGCLNNITDYKQTNGIKRFRCMQCGYDLCEKCFNKYFDKNFVVINDDSNNRGLYLFKKQYLSQAHEHPLIFLDKSKEDGWACNGKFFTNKCLSGITDFNQTKNIPRFRCEKCDFDLCENCMNFSRKKNFYELNKEYKVNVHRHPLKFLGIRNEGWLCDGKNLKEKCLSEITDFNQTDGFERFRCDKCDFDLCRNCMDYYYNNKKGCIIF